MKTTEKLSRYLKRIAQDNPHINAALDIYESQARETAGRLDASMQPLSNLQGVICGIKANIAVKNHTWHGGIKAYENTIAGEDAMAIQRLKSAGAVILCSLNMEEGALGAQTDNPWYGKTYNPLKHGYTPGGSSGGSAAAIAAGFVQMALGTDTMGSVRIPSGYCGLFGFKPSHSKKMLQGVMPLSPTLDTVGVHTRTLDEAAAGMEALLGRVLTGRCTDEIAVLDWGSDVSCTPDVTKAFKIFTGTLHIKTKPVHLNGYEYGRSRRAGLLISEVEGMAFHRSMLQKNPSGFSNTFRKLLEWGDRQSPEKIDAAYGHINELRKAKFPDFILMPTAPQTAFMFGDPVPANQADFTAFANLADRPAICFPIGTNSQGLPISAQLVGPRGGEADLVSTLRHLL